MNGVVCDCLEWIDLGGIEPPTNEVARPYHVAEVKQVVSDLSVPLS